MRHTMLRIALITGLFTALASSASAEGPMANGPGLLIVSSIDTINGGSVTVVASSHSYRPPTVHRGHLIVVSGWAVDATRHSRARGVTVVIDGKRFVRASYGAKRPDVAASLHSSAYTHSGFTAAFPTDNLAPGRHIIRISVTAGSQRGSVVEPQRVPFIIAGPVGLQGLKKLPRGTDLAASIDWVTYGSHVVNVRTSPVVVPAGDAMTVGGWALDGSRPLPAGAVFVSVDGTESFHATYGLARADVVHAFHNTIYRHCGFVGAVPAGRLTAGQHQLTIKVVSWNLKGYSELLHTIQFVVK